jgi:ATP/maltotriose-dependent transcriptional regulator MalT
MTAVRDTATITERERRIIELLAQGFSNAEMSSELGMPARTVKAQCDTLRKKLGVRKRRQLPLAYRLLTGEDPLAAHLAGKRG